MVKNRWSQTRQRCSASDAATSGESRPSGQDVQSVANAYGVNIRSVFRWLAEFANGGQNALLMYSWSSCGDSARVKVVVP